MLNLKKITLLFLACFLFILSVIPTQAQSTITNARKITPESAWEMDSYIQIPGSYMMIFRREIFGNQEAIKKYIKYFYQSVIGITGILAVIVIAWAGILLLTSGGDAGKVATARGYIGGALFGLILALSSYIILETINPNIVALRTFANINKIARQEVGCMWQKPPCGEAKNKKPADNNEACGDNKNPEENKYCCCFIKFEPPPTESLASYVYSNPNILKAPIGDCRDGTANRKMVTPASNLIEAMAGKPITTCNSSCKSLGTPCTGQAQLSDNILLALSDLAQYYKIIITSIGGGQHTNNNSNHYKGKAIDIKIPNLPHDEWGKAINILSSAYGQAFCDDGSGPSHCSTATHIHFYSH